MAVEERLAELRRRVDRLEARTRKGAASASARLRRQLVRLRHDEASARTSIHRAAGVVEDRLEQLGNEVDIAEHRFAAELANDRNGFVEAVETVLHDWDVALERTQAKAAQKPGPARRRLEDGIAVIRRYRTAVTKQVSGVRTSADDSWHEAKARVLEALDELERQATAVHKHQEEDQ